MSPEGYQSNTKNKKGNKVLIGKIRKFSSSSGIYAQVDKPMLNDKSYEK